MTQTIYATLYPISGDTAHWPIGHWQGEVEVTDYPETHLAYAQEQAAISKAAVRDAVASYGLNDATCRIVLEWDKDRVTRLADQRDAADAAARKMLRDAAACRAAALLSGFNRAKPGPAFRKSRQTIRKKVTEYLLEGHSDADAIAQFNLPKP